MIGLFCMISSQLHQQLPELDEVITSEESDFLESGLKLASVIRISRLAVISGEILLGKLGRIDQKRLIRIKENIIKWIKSA